jgi:hypothetical protein
LLDELPVGLRAEVATFTHEKLLQKVQFLKDKDPLFVLALLPLLKNVKLETNEVVYKEGDLANESKIS